MLLPLVPARADRPARRPQRGSHLKGKTGQTFWSWLMDPHSAEIRLILRKEAELEKKRLRTESPYDYTGTFSAQRAETRRHLLAEAEGMLRYALRLEPHQLEVERALAVVLDENQRPGAQAALERYLGDLVPGQAASSDVADVRNRLAQWYARQRRWEDAARQLRLALGVRVPDRKTRIEATLLLSSIYMNTGRLPEAIDLLRSANPAPSYTWGADYLTPFALAVAYDRDEQITRAHDVLERLASNQEALSHALMDQSSPPDRNPLIPTIETHYFRGLQYEALGFLPEARVEWVAYARTPGAPYRARALQHVADIDRMLKQAEAQGTPSKKPPPPPRHHPPVPRRRK